MLRVSVVGECRMPLSRLLGYYCLLMLLCSVVFARWLPPTDFPNAAAVAPASADKPAGKPAPLRVSLRPAPRALLLESR